MTDRLLGKTAMITGGGSGIGRAQALRFASEGATIVVVDVDAAAAEDVVSEVRDLGAAAMAVDADITDEVSVRQAVSSAIDRFSRIDILSNTAGVYERNRALLDVPRKLWDQVLAVNVTGMYVMTSALLPHFLSNGGGVVLNIASTAGLRGGGGGGAYTTAKHGVIGFTRQLTAGYGNQGIRSVAIAPGPIDTPMVADVLSDPSIQELIRASPAGRVGMPVDIANAATFLVSDEATFIHGAVLVVDGGRDAIY